jgi:lycopene epsilon-cyclase
MQASFHIFGMELLTTLDVQYIHEFFHSFFRLPDAYWRGFLASKLSSLDLMKFALLTFIFCTPGIRTRLIQHLLTHPSGRYLVRTYTTGLRDALSSADKTSRDS